MEQPDTQKLQAEFERKRLKGAAVSKLLQGIKIASDNRPEERQQDCSRFDGLSVTFTPARNTVLVSIPASAIEPPWSRENARPLSDWIRFLREQPKYHSRQLSIAFDDDLSPPQKDLQQLAAARITLLRPYHGQPLILGATARVNAYLDYEEKQLARKNPGRQPG